MNGLKVKEYAYRFKQFKETFESIYSEGSSEYTTELHNAFKKSLNEKDIAMPSWICQPHTITGRRYEY